MNILETIIAAKRIEVASRKESVPLRDLERSAFFDRAALPLSNALIRKNSSGIIAEFKRRSPSKGDINMAADVTEVTRGYVANGAAALSVLTDTQFFGGTSDDLRRARANKVPILRKDFVIDEYQIVEAKAIGADVVLLIAACLSREEVARLAAFATSLDLEVLLEIHDDSELGHINEHTAIVGVNNRDLKTFTVDVRRSLELGERIPADRIRISESGLTAIEDIQMLREAGFRGFLIGERFMKEPQPGQAFASFVNRLRSASTVAERRKDEL